MNILDDLKLQYKIGDMVTKLIFWNILLFAIPGIVFALLQLFNVHISYYNYVGLSNNPENLLIYPWTIVSYSFFHSGIFHILFNMIMLNFAGRLFSTYFTQKQLLSLYVWGGIFGGMVYIESYFFFPLIAK